MSPRLKSLGLVVGLAMGAVGCAQCDTCDDFPAPCQGPNCGGAYAAAATSYTARPGFVPPSMNAPAGTTAPATLGPAVDSVGPAPAAPAVNPETSTARPAIETAPSNETSPPKPTEPAPRP